MTCPVRVAHSRNRQHPPLSSLRGERRSHDQAWPRRLLLGFRSRQCVCLQAARPQQSPAFGFGPYIIGTVIVFLATTVAALFPSFRTACIDPSSALRVE
jgi:hypothetical protein